MTLLTLDARWRRFHDETRIGPDGQPFSGIFDIGFDHPDSWRHGPLRGAGTSELQIGEDKLSADLCKLGEDRFVCAMLHLPVRGADESVALAVWVQIPSEAFYAYIDFATGTAPDFPTCESLLVNALPGFGGDVPCTLNEGAEGERPILIAQDGPLKAAQEDGISFDDLLDLYAGCGQDVRPHLMAD
ncbi:MAG: DUF2199 domain-containing protein [Rhodobacteraceae bacterium]|nr:DUF2199 domain-containing protein [Paracoccaceae bacterium]